MGRELIRFESKLYIRTTGIFRIVASAVSWSDLQLVTTNDERRVEERSVCEVGFRVCKAVSVQIEQVSEGLCAVERERERFGAERSCGRDVFPRKRRTLLES